MRWPTGSFLNAYSRNRSNSRALTLEASPLPTPIGLLVADGEWSGTAAELLGRLDQLVDDSTRRRPDWPKSATKLSIDLRRIAPDLRKNGLVEVHFERRLNSKRPIRLVRMSKSPSPVSHASPSPASIGEGDTSDASMSHRTDEDVSTGVEEDYPASAWQA